MTKLYRETTNVKCVDLGRENTLPMLYEVDTKDDYMLSDLPEGDGLFLRYNYVKSAFPYRALDNYNRTFTGKNLECVVLENDYLKASFAPSMGGKLWSLFDKVENRELLFANPVVQPAYLAACNAWCSGGVEWNCGIFGHSPMTCRPIFAAKLQMKDGTPVLRMYEYERVRGVVYQMDFWIPETSRVLFARMRVVNPAYRSVPIYWWSNIAVPQVEGARVVVPADSAYTPVNNVMSVVPIPVRRGIDVTYPNNNPVSVDYFFRTDKKRRMYHSQLSPEGYGLFETSTARLQGRKIFVWGQGPGGRKWQEYLSGEGCLGRYCEIQCGLAHTQSEHLPMPPRTAWEWMEVYGAMHADPAKIHGSWDEARGEVEARLDDVISAQALEQLLIDTREMALTPAQALLNVGSGWGALENIRREKQGFGRMCAHLDFGATGEEQAQWLELLETGSMGAHSAQDVPPSWMRQLEWTRMMEKAVGPQGADAENWYTYLQLGVTYLAEPDLIRAQLYIEKSLGIRWSPWGMYAQAELFRLQGEAHRAALTMVEAANLLPGDASLAKAAARLLNITKDWHTLESFTASRPEAVQAEPRIRLYRAAALLNTGDIEGAEALFHKDGKWLEVPDVQEGEISMSDLWYGIEEAKAGHAIDRDQVSPPYEVDFRMFAEH